MSIAHDDSFYSQQIFAAPKSPGAWRPAEHHGRLPPWLHALLSFEGRIGPGRFWLLAAASSAAAHATLVLMVVLAQRASSGMEQLAILLLGMLLMVPCGWVQWAAHVRRWHDRGKSGLWVFINCIPQLGLLWTLIELGFLPGTPGENDFGPAVAHRPAPRLVLPRAAQVVATSCE